MSYLGNIFDHLDHNAITVHILMNLQEKYPNLNEEEYQAYHDRTTLRINLLCDFAKKNGLAINKTLLKQAITGANQHFLDEILNDLPILDKPVAASEKRGWVFLFNGGPATGKSNFIKEMEIPEHTVILDRDSYFEYLTPYPRLKQTHPNHATHAVVCEAILYNERDAYRYSLLAGAQNILVDGTMSYLDLGLEMIKNAQQHGYKVKVINLDCELDTAIIRAEKRAKKVGKTINAKLLYESHVRCAKNFFLYKEQADLSESWYTEGERKLIYGTNEKPYEQALSALKNKGTLRLDKPDWPPNFDEFLSDR